MSKKPITYVHYWPYDHSAMISHSPSYVHHTDEIKHTYRNVTPSSAKRLVAVLSLLIERGGCDVLLGTGYSPTSRSDIFYSDWAVFTPAWDSIGQKGGRA